VNHSPAQILAKYLTDQSIFSATLSNDWALFVGHLPQKPSRAGALFDVPGSIDGRYMGTGEVKEHPGVSLQVRGKDSDYKVGKDKLDATLASIQALDSVSISIGGDSYLIENMSRIAAVSALGPLDSQRRATWVTSFRMEVSTV